MADKIRTCDVYNNLPLAETIIDDFQFEDTALWTTTIDASGTSTAAASVMTLVTDTNNNDATMLSFNYGTIAQNRSWEATVRFRTHTAAADYMIGWILNSNVSANAIPDTEGGPVAGAFCGIYANSSDLRVVLAGQGASETRQTKSLDWVFTASSTIWRTVRLRLEAGLTTMKLSVFNDPHESAGTLYYPESASRYGVNNLAPVRGYQDHPLATGAYIDNITVHAASQAFIVGVKTATTAAATMAIDYVGLCRTR